MYACSQLAFPACIPHIHSLRSSSSCPDVVGYSHMQICSDPDLSSTSPICMPVCKCVLSNSFCTRVVIVRDVPNALPGAAAGAADWARVVRARACGPVPRARGGDQGAFWSHLAAHCSPVRLTGSVCIDVVGSSLSSRCVSSVQRGAAGHAHRQCVYLRSLEAHSAPGVLALCNGEQLDMLE